MCHKKKCHKRESQKSTPKSSKSVLKSVPKMYGDSGKSGAFGESGQTLCTNICNINGMAWEVANGAIFKQLPVLATCHSIDGEAYTCSRMSSSLKTGKNKRHIIIIIIIVIIESLFYFSFWYINMVSC